MNVILKRVLGRPLNLSFARTRAFRAVVLGAVLASCSDGRPSEPLPPVDQTPVIAVVGVQDGAQSQDPVTITITVTVGAFTARLNGVSFASGSTVSAAGAYLLQVSARNGSATAELSLNFTILVSGETALYIRLFDLGNNESGGGGDAILVSDSTGAGIQHVLVDAGPAGAGASDPAFVLRQLQALGVDTLEALILSHAHSDHFAGMTSILQNVSVKEFFYNGQVRNLSFYTNVLNAAQAFAGAVTIPAVVTTFDIGLGQNTTTLSVLPPLGTYIGDAGANSSEQNEGSLGAEVSKGTFRMFLTGDSEVEANQRWRTLFSGQTANLDVLKVGHHGANDAVFDNGFNGGSAWLSHASPDVAVLSANGATHPRQNATNFLLGLPGTQTFCTNVHGDIEIRVAEDGSFTVTVEKNANSNCVPGTDATT